MGCWAQWWQFVKLLHSYFVFLLITPHLGNTILYKDIDISKENYTTTVNEPFHTYFMAHWIFKTLLWLWNIDTSIKWLFLYFWEFESHSWRGLFDTPLCDKLCLWLVASQWFSLCIPVSSISQLKPTSVVSGKK